MWDWKTWSWCLEGSNASQCGQCRISNSRQGFVDDKAQTCPEDLSSWCIVTHPHRVMVISDQITHGICQGIQGYDQFLWFLFSEVTMASRPWPSPMPSPSVITLCPSPFVNHCGMEPILALSSTPHRIHGSFPSSDFSVTSTAFQLRSLGLLAEPAPGTRTRDFLGHPFVWDSLPFVWSCERYLRCWWRWELHAPHYPLSNFLSHHPSYLAWVASCILTPMTNTPIGGCLTKSTRHSIPTSLMMAQHCSWWTTISCLL